jgi:hypothetical protein
MDDVSDFIRDIGTNDETCYQYGAIDGTCGNACANWRDTASSIDSWFYVDNTVNDIKTAIYNYGPVVSTFIVYSDFYSYRSGVYTYTWGPREGGHAIIVTGWDDANSCFIVKNSWNTGWGESGYFRIAYTELTNNVEFGFITISYHSDTDISSPPIANAGVDQTVNENQLVTLDGSDSYDSDGKIISYFWEQINGTTVTLSAPNSIIPTFYYPDTDESLIFQLTVTDDDDLKDTDTCIIKTEEKPYECLTEATRSTDQVDVWYGPHLPTDYKGMVAEVIYRIPEEGNNTMIKLVEVDGLYICSYFDEEFVTYPGRLTRSEAISKAELRWPDIFYNGAELHNGGDWWDAECGDNGSGTCGLEEDGVYKTLGILFPK